MKKVNRGVLGLLLAPVVFTAAFFNASCSIRAYADEYLSHEKTSEEVILTDTPNNPEKEDTDSDNETELFSDTAISSDGAISKDSLTLNEHEENGSEDSLLQDNFTASNSVTEMLTRMPDASAIKAVIPEFDENKHYVVWYVMKTALSSYPDWDVILHVDGVIREKTSPIIQDDEPEVPTEDPKNPGIPEIEPQYPNPSTLDPKNPDAPVVVPKEPTEEPSISEEDFTPEELEEIKTLGSEVEIELETLFLDENGNEVTEIPYDGQEHLVGGFSINVIDKADHSLFEQLKFNYKGEPLVYAADECTFFKVRDRLFSVNVTGAYARAKDLGTAIISFYSGSTKLNGPEDIKVSDEKGRAITSYLNIIPKTGSVTVTQKTLTIEAGTSVRNDDGSTLTNDSYEITSGSLLDGHSIERVVFNGSQSGAGESSNEITSVTIVDASGKDVTALYNIKTVDGRLVLVDAGKGKTSTETPQLIENDKAKEQTESSNDSVNASVFPEKDNYQTVEVILENGDTTHVKVTNDFSAANASEDVPEVLGARRSATGDNNSASTRIILILFGAATIVAVLSKRKEKKKAQIITENTDSEEIDIDEKSA